MARRCPTPDKVGYRNKQQARQHAKTFTRQLIASGEFAEPLYRYECPVGGHWHLTRRPEWDGAQSELLISVPPELQRWAQTPASSMERVSEA